MPYTNSAAVVFASTTAGGAPRGANMDQARIWGTEVEADIAAARDEADDSVVAEASARAAADLTLQANIDAEAVARAAADADLQAVVDAAAATFLTGAKPLIGSVRVLTTADTATATAMENGDTLDGVTLATGDRVAKAYNGATGVASNGIWVVQASGAAVRATDANTDAELRNGAFYVDAGTYQGELWAVKNTSAITVDTTPIVIEKARDAVGYEAEVIAARDGFDALDDRLTEIDEGKITAGHASRGIALVKDQAGNAAVLYDPAGGPAIVHGDRYPTLPGINLVFVWGQSVGSAKVAAAQPPRNTAPRHPYRASMISSIGMEGLDNTDIATFNLNSLVAAREVTYETRCSGFAAQLLKYEDDNSIASPHRVFVNVSWGGASYSAIKKGTVPFTNMIKTIRHFVAKYGAQNVRVECVLMDGGESDFSASAATYLGYLEEAYDDINDVVDGLIFETGQGEAIPLLLTQTPLRNDTNLGVGVLQGQLDAHIATLADPTIRQIYLLGPRYNHWYGDNLHPSAYGQEIIGHEQGQAWAEIKYEDENALVYMTGASRASTKITVTTSAVSALAIDTTTLKDSDLTDYGFVVRDTSEVVQTITDVSVVGTTIEITLSGTAPAGYVDYAIDNSSALHTSYGPGGFGNIRDTRDVPMALNPDQSLYGWLCAGRIGVA